MTQTPAAAQAKRRRRTQDDSDEGKEKLPLEDEDLLARLVVQQRATLQDYRRQLNLLRRQHQQQQQQAAEAARCAAAVCDAWAALNADLLLLLPQQQPLDPELHRSVQALLRRPGLCLFDSRPPEGNSGNSSGETEKGQEAGSSKAEDVSSGDEEEAFVALLRKDSGCSSTLTNGASSGENELEQLKQRLLACRKWSCELFQQLVVQLLRRPGASEATPLQVGPQDSAQTPAAAGDAACATGGVAVAKEAGAGSPAAAADSSSSDSSKTPAVSPPGFAPAAGTEAAAAAAAVAATAAGLCPKCLALQSALRRLRLRAGSWRTRARVAETQQHQSAEAAAAAELEISRLKKQQVMLRAAAGAPAAAALLTAAIRGDEINDDDEAADGETQHEQQQQPSATADAAAATAKGSSPSSPGAGERVSEERQPQQQLHQQQHENSSDDEAADAAVLRIKLQQKEQQVQQLVEEQSQLRKAVDEAAAMPTIKRMQIMKSPPFMELQQLCAQRDAVLAAKSAEVDELRRELLAEQSKADAAFEELARKQTEAREQLSERLSAALEENQTLKTEKEDALREVEAIKRQLEASHRLQQELETASAQRALQLTQMRMQFEQLKNASNQVLVRNERLKTEKQRIIEALKASEVNCLRLTASLQSGEASATAAEGTAAGHAAPATTPAGAAAVKEGTVKVEETELGDKPPETKAGTEAERKLLRIELEAMQRRLNEQQELEAEVLELRQQYARVTEELEEVSKAFEERQTHCEHLLRQLKERDETLLQQKAAAEAALQQQGLLQRIGRLQEQKLQLEKQHVDQLAASTRAFSEALQQAQHRAAVADQQRDEIASCFHALRAEREKLFKANDEMARELELLTETNKASQSVVEQHQAKVQILEASLRRQTEARAEADKRLERFKEKQERQERKRLLAAAEDPSLAINHLLQEENDTMRRRLLCGVCNERFKDHMLAKCGHMFCQECIEKNVKARNRKCPHCKTQFDQKDIRKAYLHN